MLLVLLSAILHRPGASAYATGTALSYPSSTGTTTRYTPSTRLA
uniref:Uncharacterized protein n=1 Tax=Picea glauca TaxID=3330 RepID=A0A101LXF6_PICGL|nr:hypothetical protein ABT39_MTgene6147 [Picea glauca]QHR88796.1 hypothetical protein Q903MT_gene2811 [Picea sitchensis]